MASDYPFASGVIDDESQEILERTVLQGWMQQWLAWVSWYYRVAVDYNTSLQDLVDYPVVERSWKRRNVDSTLSRFGFVFKLYDLARKGSKGPPLILEPLEIITKGDLGRDE